MSDQREGQFDIAFRVLRDYNVGTDEETLRFDVKFGDVQKYVYIAASRQSEPTEAEDLKSKRLKQPANIPGCSSFVSRSQLTQALLSLVDVINKF